MSCDIGQVVKRIITLLTNLDLTFKIGYSLLKKVTVKGATVLNLEQLVQRVTIIPVSDSSDSRYPGNSMCMSMAVTNLYINGFIQKPQGCRGDAGRIIGLDIVNVTKHRTDRNALSIFKGAFNCRSFYVFRLTNTECELPLSKLN